MLLATHLKAWHVSAGCVTVDHDFGLVFVVSYMKVRLEQSLCDVSYRLEAKSRNREDWH